MPGPVSFLILYVEQPARSAAFYEKLLGRAPLEASETFVMFPLEGGQMLGLWKREGVQPAPQAAAGGMEMAFTVQSPGLVDQTFVQWQAQGVRIAQEPLALDFGYTFVGLDPDGHRLRVFAPGA